MHDAFDTVTKMRHVEVDQQSDFVTTKLEISQHLRDVKREQLFNGLQFDDDAVFDEKVYAVARVDLNVVVKDGQPELMIETDAILLQLISKTSIVGALQAAGAQSCVHLHRRAQNLLCDLFVQHLVNNLRFLHSSVVESLRTEAELQSSVL
jgi:hypothetical protein